MPTDGAGLNKPAAPLPSPSQQLQKVAGDLSSDKAVGLFPWPKTSSLAPSPTPVAPAPSRTSGDPVELVPEQKRRLERAKEAEGQLWLVGKNRHPEQISLNQQVQPALERDLKALDASRKQERLKVDAERGRIEQKWKDLMKREFSVEGRQYEQARKNLADSRARLEASSPGSGREVEAHLQLCERLADDALTGEVKEKLRREVESSQANLVKRLNKPDQSFSKPSTELRSVLTAHQKLLDAGKFPKNSAERQAWNIPNGNSRTSVETERDGVKTTLDTTRTNSQVVEVETKEGHGETTIIQKVDGKLVSRTERWPITPNPDVDGLDSRIFSHNPQKLVERLGDENSLRGGSENVRSFDAQGALTQNKTTTKLISHDGKKELLQTSARGGDLWELREKNEDGTWNSQTFFQGTRDTIVKKERIEGEFHVQEERSNTEELAKKNNIPSKSHGTQHASEAATVASVTKLLANHRMGAVQNDEGYQKFLQAHGDGKLKVLVSAGSSTLHGKERLSGNLLLESADGSRLLAVYDAEKETYVVSQQPRGSEGPTRVRFLRGPDHLEIGANGSMRERIGSGGEWRELALNSVEAAQLSKDRFNDARSASDILHRIAKSKKETGALLQFTDAAATGRWSNFISGGAGSAAAALQGLSLAANWANGDIEGAVSSGGKLGTNVAEVIKLSNDNAWKAAATGGRAGWLARSGRVLGFAGMVVGAAEAGKDLSEGKYVGGGLKVAATTGGAYALLGASSFAGPVGWGIAGGATLAGLAWDHNEETKIADLAL